MASPTLALNPAGAALSSASSWNLSLPSGITAGQKIAILIGLSGDQATAPSFTFPGGWTKTEVVENAEFGVTAAIASKTAVGDEGGTTINVTCNVSERPAYKVWVVSGAGTPVIASATGNTDTPDCPNATFGSSTDGLAIACCVLDANRDFTSFPSGYSSTGEVQSGGNFNLDCTLAWGTKAFTASSENPGAFGADGSDNWIGFTILFPEQVASISLDAADYEPGETITITRNINWLGTPTATLNGVAITLSNISGATATAVVPAKTVFAASQAHSATAWNTNITLAVTDGSVMNATLQIIPVDTGTGNHSGNRTGTQYYPVTGAADGNYQHTYWESGSGISNAESSYGRALTVPSTLRIMAFASGAWLAHRVVVFDTDTDSWPFRDLFAGTDGDSLAGHTPNATIFPAGWSAIERDAWYSPAASTGVSIVGNALRINGATRGVSVDTEQVVKTLDVPWPVNSANDVFVIHPAREDEDTWMSIVCDAAADRVTLYQAVDQVSVGTPVTSTPITFSAGNTYSIRVQIIAPVSPSVLHTVVVQVNGVQVLSTPALASLSSQATRVGLYSGGVFPIDVLSAFILCADFSAVFGITLASATALPGATVVVTKQGGNFSGAVSATFAGVACTINSVSGATANLIVPALTAFLLGGGHVNTAMYVNQPVTVTDNDGTFNATLQIIAAAGGHGLAGPGPYDNNIGNVQLNVPVLLRQISGTPTLVPSKVRATGTGTVGGRAFIAGAWTAETEFAAIQPIARLFMALRYAS